MNDTLWGLIGGGLLGLIAVAMPVIVFLRVRSLPAVGASTPVTPDRVIKVLLALPWVLVKLCIGFALLALFIACLVIPVGSFLINQVKGAAGFGRSPTACVDVERQKYVDLLWADMEALDAALHLDPEDPAVPPPSRSYWAQRPPDLMGADVTYNPARQRGPIVVPIALPRYESLAPGQRLQVSVTWVNTTSAVKPRFLWAGSVRKGANRVRFPYYPDTPTYNDAGQLFQDYPLNLVINDLPVLDWEDGAERPNFDFNLVFRIRIDDKEGQEILDKEPDPAMLYCTVSPLSSGREMKLMRSITQVPLEPGVDTPGRCAARTCKLLIVLVSADGTPLPPPPDPPVEDPTAPPPSSLKVVIGGATKSVLGPRYEGTQDPGWVPTGKTSEVVISHTYLSDVTAHIWITPL